MSPIDRRAASGRAATTRAAVLFVLFVGVAAGIGYASSGGGAAIWIGIVSAVTLALVYALMYRNNR